MISWNQVRDRVQIKEEGNRDQTFVRDLLEPGNGDQDEKSEQVNAGKKGPYSKVKGLPGWYHFQDSQNIEPYRGVIIPRSLVIHILPVEHEIADNIIGLHVIVAIETECKIQSDCRSRDNDGNKGDIKFIPGWKCRPVKEEEDKDNKEEKDKTEDKPEVVKEEEVVQEEIESIKNYLLWNMNDMYTYILFFPI